MAAKTAAIVVTSCGKRKSLAPAPALCAAALRPGDPASVAKAWARHLSLAGKRVPARQLYQGRAFREAELAALPTAGGLYVISAGLGLIPAELEIPPYSLTVANGTDNILSRLESSDAAQASTWWRELTLACDSHSFKDLARKTSSVLLLAAGSSYLSMVAPDLAGLDRNEREKLRIFTAAPLHSIPAFLHQFVMPYDRRLEALPGRSGTLSDFAQRALRHFAEIVLPAAPLASSSIHAAAVIATLEGLDAPTKRSGRSKTDDEIIALIRENWNHTAGKSTAMLRLLRDSFCVACEQKRFKKLFAVVRTERTR